jgi:SAM-dependent methyltransferase
VETDLTTERTESAPSQTELVRRYFSAAKEYAQLYEETSPSALFFNERLQRVLEFLAPIGSGRVLDVGCGPGVLLSRLASRPLEIFGLDLSPEMIAAAKARAAGLGVSLAVGRLEYLPYLDSSFDVALGLGVLEYLPDQRAALFEIARVAKPGAIVILSMVNKLSLYRWWERSVYRVWKWLRSPGHRSASPEPRMWLQSRKSLARMMEAAKLEPFDVTYFDPNVCVAPFDSKFPKQASALNSWVKLNCSYWLFPVVHTAFLMRARRRP